MALTSYQRFVRTHARKGLTFQQIGALWRSKPRRRTYTRRAAPRAAPRARVPAWRRQKGRIYYRPAGPRLPKGFVAPTLDTNTGTYLPSPPASTSLLPVPGAAPSAPPAPPSSLLLPPKVAPKAAPRFVSNVDTTSNYASGQLRKSRRGHLISQGVY